MVPSYFDFVRLRNFLDDVEASFVGLSEYSSHSESQRGRAHFVNSRLRLLLYTERHHFYKRIRIRGVKVGACAK